MDRTPRKKGILEKALDSIMESTSIINHAPETSTPEYDRSSYRRVGRYQVFGVGFDIQQPEAADITRQFQRGLVQIYRWSAGGFIVGNPGDDTQPPMRQPVITQIRVELTPDQFIIVIVHE